MSHKDEIKEKIISITTAQKRKDVMSKEDINALFLGLAKIVKKSAMAEVNAELKRQYLDAQHNFTTTLKDLSHAEAQINTLLIENARLESLIDTLRGQICMLLTQMN